MARAVGAGTRLPRRERAHAAGLLPTGTRSMARRGQLRGAGRRVSCIPVAQSFALPRRSRSWFRCPASGRFRPSAQVPTGHALPCAPFRRSQRSRRLRSPQRRPMPQRAVKGQGPFDISERRPSPYRAQRVRPLTAAARAKQLFSAKTVDKAKRWCYHSCKQRRRRQSRYESSTHEPQLRLLLYL